MCKYSHKNVYNINHYKLNEIKTILLRVYGYFFFFHNCMVMNSIYQGLMIIWNKSQQVDCFTVGMKKKKREFWKINKNVSFTTVFDNSYY